MAYSVPPAEIQQAVQRLSGVLVDRLEQRGLLERERSTEDKREVLLRLTAAGDELLQRLSLAHRQHLAEVGPEMVAALGAILAGRDWDSWPSGEPDDRAWLETRAL